MAVLGGPDRFQSTLGTLPPRVTIRTKAGAEADVIVLFATKFARLKTEFVRAMRMMPGDGGMLWIAWPKKAAKMDTDLDENLIRDYGLSLGIVDTKVCAIDETWSGLRFNRRRTSGLQRRRSLIGERQLQPAGNTPKPDK